MEFTQEQQSAYLKAAAICSRSETCTSEIRKKLKTWGLNEDDSMVVISQLKEEKNSHSRVLWIHLGEYEFLMDVSSLLLKKILH